MMMPTTITVLAFLVTYLIHSTLLLGAAWALTRYVVGSEAWRETLWKSALIGGLATSVAAQAAPWTPLRVTLPGLRVESSRVSNAAASPERLASPEDPAAAGHRSADLRGSAELSGSSEPGAETGSAAETSRRQRADAPFAGSTQLGSVEGRAAGAEAPMAGPSANAQPHLSGTGEDGGGPGAWRAAVMARLSWPVVVLLVWTGIALLLLGRLTWRHVQLGRMLRNRRVVTEPEALSQLAELRRMAGVWVPVGLTSTGVVASPLVLGRREICVPERFLTQLGPDEQRAALAHELAHLARRDPAWLLGAMLLECVFFFQPLQRIARRRLRETAEYRADIWAVRVAGGRLSLARCLAEVAAWVAPAPHPALAERVAMAEGGSPLLSRVSRLLEWRTEPEPRTGLRVGAGVALIAAAAALAPGVGVAGVEHPASVVTGQVEQPGSAPASVPPAGTADDENSDQDTLEVLRFDGPAREGGSFVARLNAAGRHAGARPYWVAYAVPASAAAGDLVIDSEPWDGRSARGRGVGEVLGIESGPGGAYGREAIMFAQLLPQGAATRVLRLASRGPQLGLNLTGRVYWLGRAESEESVRWLRDIYNAVPQPRIRETAVDLIAVHPVASAESFLRRVIETADDRNIREQAVEGLGHHPTDDVLALLVRLAETDGDRLIAGEAAETLGDLDHRGAAGALRELVRSGAADVREEALESLVQRGDTALAELLLDIALNDPDPRMRAEAVECMAELLPAVAVSLLSRVVFEGNNDVAARQAVETLGDIGTIKALEVLDEIIARNPGEDASFQAVESIAENFSRDLALPRLTRIAREHPSSRVRREALDHLRDLDGGP